MIAKIISRFAIFEQLYLFHSKLVSQSQKALEEALVRLYAVIIRYLAKAKRYFEQNTASLSFHYWLFIHKCILKDFYRTSS